MLKPWDCPQTGSLSDLARVRVEASPQQTFQASHRSLLRLEGPRCLRPWYIARPENSIGRSVDENGPVSALDPYPTLLPMTTRSG